MAAQQLLLSLPAAPSSEQEAPATALPAVLAAPPWRMPRPTPAAPLCLERVPDAPFLRWAGGDPLSPPAGGEGGAGSLQAAFRLEAAAQAGRATPDQLRRLGREAALDAWLRLPASAWVSLRPADLIEILARFGLEALPGLLRYAGHDLEATLPALVRIAAPSVAGPVALAFAGHRRLRRAARRWLLREPHIAALGLLPDVFGDTAARQPAHAALRLLARHGHAAALTRAGQAYGADAVGAVRAWLGRDPLCDVPPRRPRMPAWWSVEGLPRPRLRDGRALPPEAVRHLGEMLSFTPEDPAYLGLEQVRVACAPASLDAFVQALLDRWEEAGAPPQQEWVLAAAAHLGGPASARHLAARIRAWSRLSGGGPRAIRGVWALALIPGPLPAVCLYDLAEHARQPSIRLAAWEALDDLALDTGTTPGGLLDAAVADLSRAEPQDHPLALRATRARLERAMIAGERWTPAAWQALCRLPLLHDLTRPLAWALYDAREPERLLHVLPATAGAEPPQGGLVGLPHPLDLPDDLLARLQPRHRAEDQPFPQLHRPFFRPTSSMAVPGDLVGRSVEPARLLGMVVQQGWSWSQPTADGTLRRCERPLRERPGHSVAIELSPGLDPRQPAPQVLHRISLPEGLPPRLFSELVRTLLALGAEERPPMPLFPRT